MAVGQGSRLGYRPTGARGMCWGEQETQRQVLSDNQEAVCSPSFPAVPGSSILHHHPWPVLSFHPSRAPLPETKTCPSMSLPSLPPTSLNNPTRAPQRWPQPQPSLSFS